MLASGSNFIFWSHCHWNVFFSTCFRYTSTAALLSSHAGVAAATTVADVQPTDRDTVHTVWPNGPSISDKLGGPWPSFSGSTTVNSDARCDVMQEGDSFTGYTSSGGAYCMASDNAINANKHLLIYSDNIGLMVDVDGVSSETSTRSLIPRLGSTTALSSVEEVYQNLATVSTTVTLTTTCGDTYVLGIRAPTGQRSLPQVGLVRQGPVMTQVTVSALDWKDSTTFLNGNGCYSYQSTEDPTNPNCNQDYKDTAPTNSCPNPAYPDCQNFQQGVRWGDCMSVCTAPPPEEIWMELSVWSDSISIVTSWTGTPTIADGCSAFVTLTMDNGQNSGLSAPISKTVPVTNGGCCPTTLSV